VVFIVRNAGFNDLAVFMGRCFGLLCMCCLSGGQIEVPDAG
jgi:hypothetical protein